jgi:hypothetical protein
LNLLLRYGVLALGRRVFEGPLFSLLAAVDGFGRIVEVGLVKKETPAIKPG